MATRNPSRRLGMLTGVTCAIVVIAYTTLSQAWYRFNFGAPIITMPTLQSVKNAAAQQVLTGWALTEAGTVGGSTSGTAVGTIAGIPSPFALLVASAALALVAWRLRTTLAAVAGAILAFVAHNAVAVAQNRVENPLGGGQYMTRLVAMNRFDLCCIATAAACGVLAAQVFITKRAERQERIDAGEEVEPTLAETLSEIHIGRVLRNLSAANASEASAKVDASPNP